MLTVGLQVGGNHLGRARARGLTLLLRGPSERLQVPYNFKWKQLNYKKSELENLGTTRVWPFRDGCYGCAGAEWRLCWNAGCKAMLQSF